MSSVVYFCALRTITAHQKVMQITGKIEQRLYIFEKQGHLKTGTAIALYRLPHSVAN